jgi:hypothetical protein
VLATGRYLGSATPGPWRHVAAAVGVDPFAMGVPFVVLGSCWLVAVAVLLVTSWAVAWWAVLAVAVLTIWYLPVGTVAALATIGVLIVARARLTAR